MSKQVADRQRSSRAVVDAIVQHKSVIAAAQTALLEGATTRLGQQPVNMTVLLEQYADTLKYGMGLLSAASAAHAQEALDDTEPRERRDRCERALRDHLIPLRKQVDGLYGDPGLRSLGFWESLPSTTEVLLNYAETVMDSLQRPGLVLRPLMATTATQFDAAAHAAALKPVVKALSDALADVSREAAELSTTLIAKNKAMEINDRNFVSIAGIIERMARGAGLVEVADRIRPSSANPGVLIEVPREEDLATPAPTPDAEPRSPLLGPGFDPLEPEEPEEEPKKKKK